MYMIRCLKSGFSHLLNLWWHRLNPGVCDFKVAVRIQKNLDGAWGHRAVFQNLKKKIKKKSDNPRLRSSFCLHRTEEIK